VLEWSDQARTKQRCTEDSLAGASSTAIYFRLVEGQAQQLAALAAAQNTTAPKLIKELIFERLNQPPGIEVSTPMANADDCGDVEILTIDEAADLLRVERNSVLGLLEEGRLPGRNFGGETYRISRAALIEWLGERI
jgi:excisionase family DNA binding protein